MSWFGLILATRPWPVRLPDGWNRVKLVSGSDLASIRMVRKPNAVASPGLAMTVYIGRIWPPRRRWSGSIQTAWQWMDGLPSTHPNVAVACSILDTPGGAIGALK
jgi:hypothetical protein